MTGFLLFLLTPLAWLLVPLFAIFGKYPKLFVTPDDPVSPFGQYEPTVRSVYARWGRYAGDVYWLAFRNPLYGLAYLFKPDEFKRMSDYSRVAVRLEEGSHGRTITVRVFGFDNAKTYTEHTLYVGPLAIILGHRLWPVYSNKGVLRHPNMDARPVFSIRLKKNA
jgi:hypothetical protein